MGSRGKDRMVLVPWSSISIVVKACRRATWLGHLEEIGTEWSRSVIDMLVED